MQTGNSWSQPYYSCASAVKASIKTVRFKLSDAASLKALIIQDVRQSTKAVPTWAVESTGRLLQNIEPIWGLVSEDLSSVPGIDTFQQPAIYLPASWTFDPLWSTVETFSDATAAASAPGAALATIYGGDLDREWLRTSGVNYGSHSSWSMLLKWSELSRNAFTAGKVVDLIWTEIMANVLIGTAGRLSTSADQTIKGAAARNVRAVAFDWQYATIALVFLAMYFVLLVWTIVSSILRSGNIATLRHFLNQSAAGRSTTSERFREEGEAIDLARTKEWVRVRGTEKIFVAKDDWLVAKAETMDEPAEQPEVETVSQGRVSPRL